VKKAKRSPKKRPVRRAAGTGKDPAKPKAKAKPKTRVKVKATRKPAAKSRPGKRTRPATRARTDKGEGRWAKFVEDHGVVLASARGPVPSVAEAIAGEPIVGSWWSHKKAQAIFDALSSIDDSLDIRCFKLVDHKITFVHRRLWPALARLAEAGVLAPDQVLSIQQEHMPTGEHRNITTPFPDWVPDEVARAAQALTIDDARAQLGGWMR
jgi:hypothetical protein